MLRTTEAIVLRNRPYLEADLIVSYLTRDLGIIEAFAKSPRKIGSRFGSSLEPLTYAKISLYGKEHANLPKITRSDIIKPFNQLRESINIYLKISEILELTLRMLPVREKNNEVFCLLLNILSFLEENHNSLYIIYYKLKLLEHTGFAPVLRGCIRCGDETDRFYLPDGAMLCRDCADTSERFIVFDRSVYNLYQYLSKIEPVILKRIKVDERLLIVLEELIDAHINYNVVERINSKEFIQMHCNVL
jgi:DNA repair protein RecO (recombination protein O)